MANVKLWVLLLGFLVVAGPFLNVRAHEGHEEEDEYDGDDEEGGAAGGGGDASEADVLVLTDKNFADTIKKTKFVLAEFYAPWCGHCKKLAPEYAKAATALKKSAPNVILGKVDATVETELAGKFKVEGYPTLKWFVDGEPTDYAGPRDAEGIINWIKKKSGPAAVTVEKVDDLQKAESESPVIVLGYFSSFKGAEYDAFIKAAQTSEDATFVQTSTAAVAKSAELASTSSVAVITNFEGETRAVIPLAGKLTTEAVTELVTAEKLPLTIEFNDKNSQKIFQSGIERQLLLLAKADDLAAGAKVISAYREAATAYKGKFVFVTVDLDGAAKDPVVNYFGVKDEEGPLLLGFEMAKNKKYRLRSELTADAIKTFAGDLLSGAAQPEYKSAPIPEEPTDGDVVIVVGKNFDSIVKDPTKDVLLEVYAPWCGHCKALDPIYKKLAKRFKKVSSVVIAKMDGTENEHPDVEVKGFPTIMFFPATADKTAIPFEGGDRSLKALTKFIKKSAATPYELPKKSAAEEDEGHDEL